jgi:hypothetical protein
MRREKSGELRPTEPTDPDALYAGVYDRVSTLWVADNGWSSRNQIKRGVLDAMQDGFAVRIYNDQGLSGRLPIRDTQLIQQMRERRAELYDRIFHRVFLDEKLLDRFTPIERYQLERYRRNRETLR